MDVSRQLFIHYRDLNTFEYIMHFNSSAPNNYVIVQITVEQKRIVVSPDRNAGYKLYFGSLNT